MGRARQTDSNAIITRAYRDQQKRKRLSNAPIANPSSSIYLPNYEVTRTQFGNPSLIVYTTESKTAYYQYYLLQQNNTYHCGWCINEAGIYVTAKLEYDRAGNQYVQLGPSTHSCQPIQKTIPEKEKIVEVPSSEYVVSLPKITLFATADKKYCYEFKTKHANNFFCVGCNSLTSKPVPYLKLRLKPDGTRYVETDKARQHICEPIEYREPSPVEDDRPAPVLSPIATTMDDYNFDDHVDDYSSAAAEEAERNSPEPLEAITNNDDTDDDVPKPVPSKRSIEYEKDDEIIRAGNFEFEPSVKTHLPKRRMLVYATAHGIKACYIFHYHKGHPGNSFRCDKCARKNLALTAKWMVDCDGIEFLKCGKNKWNHICRSTANDDEIKPLPSGMAIEDEPQDEIIRSNRFEFMTGRRTGREKSQLKVYTSDEKTTYYLYNYQMADRKYRCGKCRNKGQNLVIHWKIDTNGVEYLKLSKDKKQHLCSPVEDP